MPAVNAMYDEPTLRESHSDSAWFDVVARDVNDRKHQFVVPGTKGGRIYGRQRAAHNGYGRLGNIGVS